LAFFAANRPPGLFIGIATRGHTIEERDAVLVRPAPVKIPAH
jgi:hypothetical protein